MVAIRALGSTDRYVTQNVASCLDSAGKRMRGHCDPQGDGWVGEQLQGGCGPRDRCAGASTDLAGRVKGGPGGFDLRQVFIGPLSKRDDWCL
jgi:hypothetical protein